MENEYFEHHCQSVGFLTFGRATSKIQRVSCAAKNYKENIEKNKGKQNKGNIEKYKVIQDNIKKIQNNMKKIQNSIKENIKQHKGNYRKI